MPKISVIVPVYKVEKFLNRCIDSILSQTYTDFDLILVDDGSPDQCGAICDGYAARDNRVIVLHQENGGLSAARNAGLDWIMHHSGSDWLTFIDSDDWVHPDYLALLYQAAVSTSTMISMGRLHKTTTDTVAGVQQSEPRVLSPNEAYFLDGENIAAFACGRLYHRSTFAQIRFPAGRMFEDLFTTHKLLFCQKKIAFVDMPLYYYFQRPDSIVHSKWEPRRLDELEAYAGLISFFENSGNIFAQKRARKAHLLAVCAQIILYNQVKDTYDCKYRKMLLSQLHKAIGQAHRDGIISVATEPWVYETAYPRIMRLYWICSHLLHKLKLKK